MRLAVVVAPSDPRAGDAVARREALAWLRGKLARNGFEVIIVGGGQEPTVALDKAALRVAPGDTLLVHVSGRLSERGLLAFGAGRTLPLRAVADALASCAPAEVAFVAELMHADDPKDDRLGPDCLATAVEALSGSATQGAVATRAVLAAVRPLSSRCARLAFTERTLTLPGDGTLAPSPDEVVASMHRRAIEDAGVGAVAPWMTFSPAGAVAEPSAPRSDGLSPEDAKKKKEPLDTGSGGEWGAWVDAPSLSPSPPPPSESEGTVEQDESPPPRGEDTFPIDAEIASASDARNWKRVLDLRLARLSLLQNPASQVNELIALARLLQAELGDPEGAISALEQARAIEPERPSVLRALRRGYETLGRWASAIEVIGVLVESASSPVERAALRVAQASLAVDRIGDEARASQWLQAAVIEDPANADAQELLTRLQAIPIDAEGIAEAELSADAAADGGEDGVIAARTDGLGFAELEVIAAQHPFDGAA